MSSGFRGRRVGSFRIFRRRLWSLGLGRAFAFVFVFVWGCCWGRVGSFEGVVRCWVVGVGVVGCFC